LFAALPHGDIRSHHRRRLRHADIDEVRHTGRPRGIDGRAHRCEVDLLELPRLRRIWTGSADEVNERVGG
jgi:hypothetical protein